ncbi:sugar phosphate isomerase/epimerase [Arthrobacter sp. V1I7]|uniref:sugar phosphate isomerase/epimerase family protein n=1 Tax=Arthrobacter sp. V1I7 TaxID=3042274 RepID=UPI00278309C6|nr:sugar phosphate isomerase/epimerase [Arthrobacter sp. V1I7]MDQ0822864.1 sugar phosphate isomerase/epimerase [Arthrobacter sp. V1I7]
MTQASRAPPVSRRVDDRLGQMQHHFKEEALIRDIHSSGARSPRRAATRRIAAAAALAIAATAALIGPAAAAPVSTTSNSAADCAGKSIPASKISIQMFSYWGWTREAGTEAVLAELSDIGYRNVEPFGGTYEGRTATEFADLLGEYGLKTPTSHGSTNEAQFDATIAYAKTIGQKYMGSGGSAAPGISTLENTLATADALNRLGERSKTAGTGKIFVHNHQGEFTTQFTDPQTGDVRSAWEILVEHTDPRYVTFQLDVLWAADADVDVASLIEEHGDRIELLHVKDGFLNGDARATPTDVGEGEIDWAPILDAAQGSVKYYVVERDGAPATREFAEDSFNFLTCYSY